MLEAVGGCTANRDEWWLSVQGAPPPNKHIALRGAIIQFSIVLVPPNFRGEYDRSFVGTVGSLISSTFLRGALPVRAHRHDSNRRNGD